MAQPAMSSGSDHTRSEGWTNRVQRSKYNQYNNANEQDWWDNTSAGVEQPKIHYTVIIMIRHGTVLHVHASIA